MTTHLFVSSFFSLVAWIEDLFSTYFLDLCKYADAKRLLYFEPKVAKLSTHGAAPLRKLVKMMAASLLFHCHCCPLPPPPTATAVVIATIVVIVLLLLLSPSLFPLPLPPPLFVDCWLLIVDCCLCPRHCCCHHCLCHHHCCCCCHCNPSQGFLHTYSYVVNEQEIDPCVLCYCR